MEKKKVKAKKTAGKKTKIKSTYGPEVLEEFSSELSRWEEGPLKERLCGEIKPQFKTYSGVLPKETQTEFRTGSGEFIINRVYTPLDVANIDPLEDIGLPGQYPYTRGRDPVGFRAFRWPLSFYTGYGSSEDAHERYRALCAAGSTELSLAFDLPTQIGFDSDHPIAEGEVGKVGLALDTCVDLQRVMEGLPLSTLHIGTVGNCISPWVLAMFYTLGEANRLDPRQMRVWLQNDPFKEYTGRGTFIFSPQVALDLASDVVEYACKYLPQWDPQYNCTTTMRWGGSTAAQEAGFGIANLICYIEAVQRKGIKPEDFVPRLNLHMTADNDLFEEVAKFRAVRRLWAKIARERFKTQDPRVIALRITVYTAAHKLTAQEPLNNVIRTTMQVLASILGGVENIHVPAHDEALALPTFESTRVANLTKHILNDECLVGCTVDPLGGSYYVESLTNQMEERARYWYDKVEAMGGAVAAIEKGFYLKEMSEGMYRYQKEIESGKRPVIGVNKFVLQKEVPIKIFKGNPEAERRQIERLNKVRQKRDQVKVGSALANVRRAAEAKAAGKEENIVPSILEAVRAYATVGEIFGLLREVFGEYRQPAII
jgi:methylmalonyl-CoA mutase N-terminal domain/subunit